MTSIADRPNDNPDSPLAEAVREGRESRGWSQGKLADRSGISKSNISRIERGLIDQPRRELLLALANALGADPKFLFFLAGHISEEAMKREAELLDELESEELTHETNELIRGRNASEAKMTGDELRASIARRFVEAAQGTPNVARGLQSIPDGLLFDQLTDYWRDISPERRKSLVAHSRDLVYLTDRDERQAKKAKR